MAFDGIIEAVTDHFFKPDEAAEAWSGILEEAVAEGTALEALEQRALELKYFIARIEDRLGDAFGTEVDLSDPMAKAVPENLATEADYNAVFNALSALEKELQELNLDPTHPDYEELERNRQIILKNIAQLKATDMSPDTSVTTRYHYGFPGARVCAKQVQQYLVDVYMRSAVPAA